jgi:DNA polymerase-3 subunit gamma/tau
MSHEVLYRKYRPYTFDDVIGQKHVVDTLVSQIEKGSPSHAYLFFGSRGIGKTSIARIFGRALGISDIDVYEIDAASNRGIDDVRALREAVKSSPFESKYKLYIIDEVHMLTKEAFNALLKTLEEPPAHIIFILATTEIEKVPETILSRCQVYTLERPTEETLMHHVVHIAKSEGYTILEDDALLIARTGDGSFRDTLGNLQKVLAGATTKKVTTDNIETVLRLPRRVVIFDFMRALVKKDKDAISVLLTQIEKDNFNIQLFLKEVITIFRELLLARFLPEGKREHLSKEMKTLVTELLAAHSLVIQSKNISRLMTAYFESRNTFLKTLPLELAVVDILESST